MVREVASCISPGLQLRQTRSMLVQGTVPAESNRICRRSKNQELNSPEGVSAISSGSTDVADNVSWLPRHLLREGQCLVSVTFQPEVLTKDSVDKRYILLTYQYPCEERIMVIKTSLGKNSVNKVHFFNQSVPV